MGTWDREIAVISLLFRGVAAIVRALFGLGRSRWRIVLPLLASVGAMVYIGLVWRVDQFLRDVLTVTFGIPAPGRPLDPSTWIVPQNGLWPDVMALSRVSMLAAGLGMLLLVARATMAADTAARRDELKRMGRPAAMVLSTWSLLPFMLHLTNQLARAFAPRSDQLLNAVGATATGGIVLAIVPWIQPLFVAVGALATLLLRAIILVGFIFWPIACALRAFDHDVAQALGRSVTASFTVAVTAKLLQAMFAFILVYLTGSITSWWLRPVVFVAGVIVVFVALPVVMLRYAERVMMLPGTLAPSEQQVGRYIEESADRVGQVHKQIESDRTRVNEWRTPTDSRDIFDTEFDDWRADASDDADAGWFGGLDASFDTGWLEWSGGDDRWWNGWIQRELIPRHSSAEWKQKQSNTRASMADGSYGPTSEGLDDVSASRDEQTDRYRSRWDRP